MTNTLVKTYRFRHETIDAIKSLTNKINKKVNLKLSMTNIIELLILDADKHPEKVIKLIKT